VNQPLRLILADDEPFICGMLTKIIRCRELGLEIVGTAHDGEQLLRMIGQLEPDIVITDISMPKMDGLVMIRSAREAGYHCRFIIISGYQQYRYAYNTLRYDVEDYLIKPVDADELNRLLEKIAASLRSGSINDQNKSYEALRAGFVEDDIYQLRDTPVELSILNDRYHMMLKPGMFQVVLVRIEQLSAERSHEDVSSVVMKLHRLMDQEFSALCHDTVYQEGTDGVLVLLNYDPEQKNLIKSRFRELLERAKGVTNMFMGLDVTVCIGDAVSDAEQLSQAKEWVRDAEWARIFYGVNRLIFSDELPSVSIRAFLVKLRELREEFVEAFTTIDIDAFHACMDSLFICPLNVLRSKEARRFCQQIWQDFFSINREKINAFACCAMLEKEAIHVLHGCISLPDYRRTFSELLQRIMERILEYEGANDKGLLGRLDNYLAKHYACMPLFSDVAAQLGVEGSALRQLLVRERSDWDSYVKRYRVELAKQWLREGRHPNRAFAAALGYDNRRSFLSEFRSLTGVSPGEYRTIFR
jgi:two-component system response regulator YesN